MCGVYNYHRKSPFIILSRLLSELGRAPLKVFDIAIVTKISQKRIRQIIESPSNVDDKSSNNFASRLLIGNPVPMEIQG